MLDSIVRLWAFSSASKSPMLVPASTLGSPVTAPAFTSSLSANVVFPQPPWPQSAMLRMSSTLYFAMPVSLCLRNWLFCRVRSPQGVAQRQRSFIQSAAYDAAGQADRRQVTHVVDGRDAAGSDHIDVCRGVHLGHRVEVRPLQHAVASDVGVDNCSQRLAGKVRSQLNGAGRCRFQPAIGRNETPP